MNDVEFENYKEVLFMLFLRNMNEADKLFNKDGIDFSIKEKCLALKEVQKKMVTKLNEKVVI